MTRLRQPRAIGACVPELLPAIGAVPELRFYSAPPPRPGPRNTGTLTISDFVIDWPAVREVMGEPFVRRWLGEAQYNRIFGRGEP